MSFDVRSRSAIDICDVDFDTFHTQAVPAHLAERGDIASRAFRVSGLESIVIAVDGNAFTWRLDPTGALEVVPGDEGRARADLDPAWFNDIVNDVRSTVALMIANEPVMTRGHITHLIAWEPVVRALLDGRAAFEHGLVGFVDRDGGSLDLDRSFALDDDAAEMSHFLAQAGFLHVRGVFTTEEMDELSTEIDLWRARVSPDDERAWMATVGDERVCVRVSGVGHQVEFPLAKRLAAIAAVAGGEHTFSGSDLLVKPVGVSEGISDLPWHKDCSLGMHSYKCCSITCGVSVTPSGSDNGQLGVVAGSHRVNMPLMDLSDAMDLPLVYLSTQRGDVTAHLSCTLHCSTPPLHSERRVTYSSFTLPGDTAELDDKIKNVRIQAARETFAPT
ncbi:MAG: phytanoyl-CoA dioxygenase family protein [Acidimicrobiales bacterium]